MTTINQLRTSLRDLPKEEALSLILKIRESRRTSKRTPRAAAKTAKKKTTKSLEALLAHAGSMSAEELTSLIQQLEEQNAGGTDPCSSE